MEVTSGEMRLKCIFFNIILDLEHINFFLDYLFSLSVLRIANENVYFFFFLLIIK